MLKIKLPKLFQRKQLSEIDIELNKYPKARRPQLKRLMEQYEEGKILKIHK